MIRALFILGGTITGLVVGWIGAILTAADDHLYDWLT